MKLPELKSKPIKGVPEGEWHLWTMKRLINEENLKQAYTPEARKKLGAAHKNKKLSPEHKEAFLSATKNLPPWNAGQSLSQEHKKSIGESIKGKGVLYRVVDPQGNEFIGHLYQVIEKFNCKDVAQYAKRKEPLKRGTFRNYTFEVYQP